jgi:hypothetical protein
MARGVFSLSSVRAKKFRNEWDTLSDVWFYQGNPVHRSAYGFRTPTGAGDGANDFFAASYHDKISWDTETASPLPGITPASNRWVMANSRDAYHCALIGTSESDTGFANAPAGNVNKIAFSNDSQSSIPSLIDYADYTAPSFGNNIFKRRDRGTEASVGSHKGSTTLGNNDAGYIIGGEKYDSVFDQTFIPSGGYFLTSTDYGFATSQYYKINYSDDVKSVLPGYSTGAYKGYYQLSFGNLERGYVGGSEAAGRSSTPFVPSSIPSSLWSYTFIGPWGRHQTRAVFRLSYANETSSRVPSLDLPNISPAVPGGAYASFSNGADGNSSAAYTMGMQNVDYEYSSIRNASSEINKISFSTETIELVSGANRSAYGTGSNVGKYGFDVRSASSGTSVYAMSAVQGSPDRFADKFTISSETVDTLPSTGLRTNMFASANGQGKPYQGGYQIPLDRGPAVNYYGQSGTPPAFTPTPGLGDPERSFPSSFFPTWGYIQRNGQSLYKIDTKLFTSTERDINNLPNPRFYDASIWLGGLSWMNQGNLTAGPYSSNGWHRWFDDVEGAYTLEQRRETTLPVHASAALSTNEYGYVTGGLEYVDINSPVVSMNSVMRSYSLCRSDTHKINYITDSVNHLPSTNLARERSGMQHGGNTTQGYVLGGKVHGTETSGNPIYITGDLPRTTDCEKITYSTETYSAIPATTVDADPNDLRKTGHTIGTMDYLYYNITKSGSSDAFQKFTFSTDSFSSLPGIPNNYSPSYSANIFWRTSNGETAMLYGHNGDTNIARIDFSTDTITDPYTTMPATNDAYGETFGYSYFDGSNYIWCNQDARIYIQNDFSGTVSYYPNVPQYKTGFNQNTPANNLLFDGACNRNNGMGASPPRTLKYHAETPLL